MGRGELLRYLTQSGPGGRLVTGREARVALVIASRNSRRARPADTVHGIVTRIKAVESLPLPITLCPATETKCMVTPTFPLRCPVHRTVTGTPRITGFEKERESAGETPSLRVSMSPTLSTRSPTPINSTAPTPKKTYGILFFIGLIL